MDHSNRKMSDYCGHRFGEVVDRSNRETIIVLWHRFGEFVDHFNRKAILTSVAKIWRGREASKPKNDGCSTVFGEAL